MSRALLTAAFLACIVAANYATTHYGMVPVGFGVTATAGTYLAGATFVLRDSIQDALGVKNARGIRQHIGRVTPLIALILIGAALSFAISAPFIALASGVAFLCSELADLVVYTPLRRRGYIRAAVASNIVGAFIDTILFLWIAGFPIWVAVPGQMVGKLAVTALAVAAVIGVRACSTSPTPAAQR